MQDPRRESQQSNQIIQVHQVRCSAGSRHFSIQEASQIQEIDVVDDADAVYADSVQDTEFDENNHSAAVILTQNNDDSSASVYRPTVFTVNTVATCPNTS